MPSNRVCALPPATEPTYAEGEPAATCSRPSRGGVAGERDEVSEAPQALWRLWGLESAHEPRHRTLTRERCGAVVVHREQPADVSQIERVCNARGERDDELDSMASIRKLVQVPEEQADDC